MAKHYNEFSKYILKGDKIMSKLQFGWAEVDLTPEKKCHLVVSSQKEFLSTLKNRLRQRQWLCPPMMNR